MVFQKKRKTVHGLGYDLMQVNKWILWLVSDQWK